MDNIIQQIYIPQNLLLAGMMALCAWLAFAAAKHTVNNVRLMDDER